jgi:hypothetical protein
MRHGRPAVVGAPDGGAYVVLTPADADLPQRLVTVGGPAAGYAITGAVPMPRVADVWGMHVLPDGAVVVVGDLADGGGYGAAAVDPATGTARTTTLGPASDGTGAVLMGECDEPREDTQMLWFVGP